MTDIDPAGPPSQPAELEALHKELLAEYLRQRALLDGVFEADPSALAVVVGSRLTLAYANPAYRFLCPQIRHDLLGQEYESLWCGEEIDCYASQIREVVETGRPFLTLGFERHFPDGEKRVFTLQARRISWGDELAALIALWDTTEQVLARESLQLEVTERQRAENKLQETNDRLVALVEASTGLLEGVDPVTRLNEFFRAFSDRLKLDVYVQYNLSADGTHLELGSWAGFPEKYKRLLNTLQLGQAVCGTVAKLRRPIIVEHVQDSEDRMTKLIRTLGVRTYACHPLIVNGLLLGTLSFGSRRLDSFDPETIDILRTFCHMVAAAMDRKRAESQFQAVEAKQSQLLIQLQEQNELLAVQSTLDPGGQALVLGPDLTFQYVNPAYRSLTPHPEIDPIGKPYDQIWPPGEGFLQRSIVDKVVQGSEDVHIQHHPRHYPDGSTRYYTFHVHRMIWHGQIAAYIVLWDTTDQFASLYSDNTERKLTQLFSQALIEIDRLINTTLDQDEILRRAISKAAEILGSETAALSLRTEDGWAVSHVYHFPESIVGAQMNDDEERHAVLAIQTHQPVAISDAYQDERVNQEHMRRWGIRSVLVIPVLLRDEPVGVIFFNFYKKVVVFNSAHLDFANQLASSLSLALNNARLVASLEVEIEQRRQVEAYLSQSKQRAIQFELQRRLLSHREQERLTIARDLHDGPMQELTAIEYAIAELAASTQDESLSCSLQEIRENIKTQVKELRAYATEMRSPTLISFGLGKAIRSHLDSFREKHPDIYIKLEEEQEGGLTPDDVRLALYRIYQESIANITRHAQATRVWIRLKKKADSVTLEIEDDGLGFDIPQDWLEFALKGHLGLAGMRERAEAVGGTLEISSQLGHGTLLTIHVPLSPSPITRMGH